MNNIFSRKVKTYTVYDVAYTMKEIVSNNVSNQHSFTWYWLNNEHSNSVSQKQSIDGLSQRCTQKALL